MICLCLIIKNDVNFIGKTNWKKDKNIQNHIIKIWNYDFNFSEFSTDVTIKSIFLLLILTMTMLDAAGPKVPSVCRFVMLCLMQLLIMWVYYIFISFFLFLLYVFLNVFIYFIFIYFPYKLQACFIKTLKYFFLKRLVLICYSHI